MSSKSAVEMSGVADAEIMADIIDDEAEEVDEELSKIDEEIEAIDKINFGYDDLMKDLSLASKTKAARCSAEVAYDTFADKYKYPTWKETKAEIFCNKKHIAFFTHYLITEYVKRGATSASTASSSETEEVKAENRANKIMLGTIKNYVSSMMALGKNKFPESAAFFKVMGGRNAEIQGSENWYMELIDQMEKIMTRR